MLCAGRPTKDAHFDGLFLTAPAISLAHRFFMAPAQTAERSLQSRTKNTADAILAQGRWSTSHPLHLGPDKTSTAVASQKVWKDDGPPNIHALIAATRSRAPTHHTKPIAAQGIEKGRQTGSAFKRSARHFSIGSPP